MKLFRWIYFAVAFVICVSLVVLSWPILFWFRRPAEQPEVGL